MWIWLYVEAYLDPLSDELTQETKGVDTGLRRTERPSFRRRDAVSRGSSVAPGADVRRPNPLRGPSGRGKE